MPTAAFPKSLRRPFGESSVVAPGESMSDEAYVSLTTLGVIAVAVILPLAIIKLRAPHPDEVAARVIPLLDALAKQPGNRDLREHLHKLLGDSPLDYRPSLAGDGGWFDRSAEALSVLAFREDCAVFVGGFFHRFRFPPGHQQKPLLWLYGILRAATPAGTVPTGFVVAAERLLADASPPEAHWLYERVLEIVQETHGAPNFKALAVRIGRAAYPVGRVGRAPTVYDEQAISNDIAARVS